MSVYILFYVTICCSSFLCFLVHSDFFGTLPEVHSFFCNDEVIEIVFYSCI